ncbi:MAG: hypothetical protein PsegKO_22220 [Pseudohongiellaceae bacterium]
MRGKLWLAGASLLAYPVMVYAHSPYPGVKGFYIGALHPLTTPAHILVIIATSLLLGTHVKESRFHCLLALFLSAALGLLLAFVLAPFLPTALLLLILLAALGLILVFAIPLGDRVYATLTGITGFLLGLESIPEPGPVLDVIITTFGALVGIHYLIMYGANGVDYIWRRWQTRITGIGIRVAGSWLTAIAALMLAFNLAGLA